jgi:hypothetical protein
VVGTLRVTLAVCGVAAAGLQLSPVAENFYIFFNFFTFNAACLGSS